MAKERAGNREKKRRFLTHENINTMLALSAALLAVASLPFEKGHVLYSLSQGEVTYTQNRDEGGDVVVLPINLTVQNLSDGPIKIVETFIGYDRNADGSCEQWMRLGDPIAFENDGFIEQGGVAHHEDLLILPIDRQAAEICLYSAWRNQRGYQRVYLESVGDIHWQMFPNTGSEQSGFSRVGVSMGDIVNVFGPSNCVALFGEEFCI